MFYVNILEHTTYLVATLKNLVAGLFDMVFRCFIVLHCHDVRKDTF